MPGVGHSDQLRIVERIKRVDDWIEIETTLTDPVVFTEPYTSTISYKRLDDELREYICLKTIGTGPTPKVAPRSICHREAGMKMKHKTRLILSALAAMALPAGAHHSTAMFDFTKTVEVTGTVKSFQWTNPHSWTTVTVTGKPAVAGDYGLEGMSPNYLARNGWSKRSLQAGQQVKFTVHPLKDGRKGGFMVSATLPDGTTLYNLPRRLDSAVR